ncbi:protein TOPAZ1 [Spea bombifrons]|uniref:protein TOPAZ1 n=1 Tax=Spea bombifrons TaxID=233779 RepID=UPI002349C7DA|nr:protein TOPAZ1 [Spea bombifrons]
MIQFQSRQLVKDPAAAAGESDVDQETRTIHSGLNVHADECHARESKCSAELSVKKVNEENGSTGRRKRGRKPKAKCGCCVNRDICDVTKGRHECQVAASPAKRSKTSVVRHQVPTSFTNDPEKGSQPKKRGRKPKARLCVNCGMCEKSKCVCVVGDNQTDCSKTDVVGKKRLVTDVSDAEKSGGGCGSGQKQMKKRGRKPKAKLIDKCDEVCGNLESMQVLVAREEHTARGNVGRDTEQVLPLGYPVDSVSYRETETCTSGPWEVMLSNCDKEREKPEMKKRDQKSGLVNRNEVVESKDAHVKRQKVGSLDHVQLSKVRTVHVRVRRLEIDNIPKKTGITSAHVERDVMTLQEPNCSDGETKTEERNDAANLNCSKMELRSSRKLQGNSPDSDVAHEKSQDTALSSSVHSLNLMSLHTCFAKCKKKDNPQAEGSLSSEATIRISKCSTADYYCRSPSLKNPVVKLYNCTKLQKLLQSSELRGPFFKVDMFPGIKSDVQHQVHHSDIVESDNIIHSPAGNENENTKELVSVANGKARKGSKRIMKVNCDIGKKTNKIANYSEEGDPTDIMSFQFTAENQDQASHVDYSTENTSDDLNNKNESVLDLFELCDKSPVKTETYAPQDQCRAQSPHLFDAEINSDNSPDMPCSSHVTTQRDKHQDVESLATDGCLVDLVEERENVSCQRVVPFTGKHIWKCSCARTSVWTFPKKRTSSVEGRDEPGLDREHSLDVGEQEVKSRNLDETDAEIRFKKMKLNPKAKKMPFLKSLLRSCFKRSPIDHEAIGIKSEAPDDASITFSDQKQTMIMSNVSSDQSPSAKIEMHELISKVISRSKDLSFVSRMSAIKRSELMKKVISRIEETALRQKMNKHFNNLTCDVKSEEPLENNAETLALRPQDTTIQSPRKIFSDEAKNKHLNKQVDESIAVPELYHIIKPKTLPDFKIPLRKPKTEQPPEHQNWCVGEPGKNVPVSMSRQGDAPEESFVASVFVVENPVPDTAGQLPSSSDEIVDNHAEGFDCYPSSSDCYPSSSYAPNDSETTESNVRTFLLMNNENSETDNSDTELSDVNGNYQRRRDKMTPDVLKAYEDDVLVLDVIQDDPDLFGDGNRDEQSSPVCFGTRTKSLSNTKREAMVLPWNVPRREKSPKSKCFTKHLKDPIESYTDFKKELLAGKNIKHDSASRCSSISEGVEGNCDYEPLLEFEENQYPQELEGKCELQEKYNQEGPAYTGNRVGDLCDQPHQDVPQTLPFTITSDSPVNHDCHPGINDFRPSGKNIPTPDMMHPDHIEKWKLDHAPPHPKSIKQSWLPLGYCKYFFNTLRGCAKMKCLFNHVPKQSDEKLCMELLHKFVDENNIFLLRRAVWVFTGYYRIYTVDVHYDPELLKNILNALINWRLWQDVFYLLNTCAIAKILPPAEMVVRLFEQMASGGLSVSVPVLRDTFCKLVEAGIIFTPGQINLIISAMSQLQASKGDINIILATKSRFEIQAPKANHLNDLDLAIAEVEQCIAKSDWIKLGTLCLDVCKGCENLPDLKKFSNCVAEALKKELKEDRHDIPFCVFADTVYKEPQLNEIIKNILGRIGISVVYHYHRNELWHKGKQVLHKLREGHINFTVLKGLSGPESSATRCQVVNTATEIFLKCGILKDAVWVLKESEWVIQNSVWPCDRMDVLTRHNLLCTVAQETLAKSMFSVCFEVLQHLPGFHDSQTDVDVSQYSILFNKLLSSCVENKSLSMSSAVADFMAAKNIPIDFFFLRELITALGQSCLWLRAREHYKCALSLGCYPPMEGNVYHKVLHIPAYLSEIEMLLAIEMFMVSNASIIQSPGGSNKILQILLKRNEDDKIHRADSYHAAADRLSKATRLSNPRLFIRHMTVNNSKEQVYILDHTSSLKWLTENLKWAGKVWLFQ